MKVTEALRTLPFLMGHPKALFFRGAATNLFIRLSAPENTSPFVSYTQSAKKYRGLTHVPATRGQRLHRPAPALDTALWRKNKEVICTCSASGADSCLGAGTGRWPAEKWHNQLDRILCRPQHRRNIQFLECADRHYGGRLFSACQCDAD